MRKRLRKVLPLLIVTALAIAVAVTTVACNKTATYTLTFVTDGGTEIAPVTAKGGESITVPADPVKDGYDFDGWYLSSDFSGDRATLPSIMPENDATYYAKFTPKAKATITLDATEYGYLSKTTYSAYVGVTIAEAIGGVIPDGEGDAVFAAWYDGEEPIGDKRLTKNVTLTAKYTVAFTVRVRMQDVDGNYNNDWQNTELPERVTANVFVGDKLDISGDSIERNKYDGFVLDTDVTKAITLDTDATKNVYSLSYKRKIYSLNYDANLPAGVSSGLLDGTTEGENYRADSTLTVKENGYVLSGYRFAGWAKTKDGAPEVFPGDSIRTGLNDVTLYARWNYGTTDANGGSDKIYVLSEKANTVVLERYGLSDKNGEYNEETGEFTFRDNGNVILNGRVLGNGTFAYFDEDFKDRTFVRYDWKNDKVSDDNETFVTDGLFQAEYTYKKDGATVTVKGKYEVESVGTYYFKQTDGDESIAFGFRFDENNDRILIREESEKAVYFQTMTSYIYLDGFGGATYFTDSENSYTGTYKFVDKDLASSTAAFEFTVGSVTLHCETTRDAGNDYGVIVIKDDLAGEYVFSVVGDRRLLTRTLKLNGYGEGSYRDTGATIDNKIEYVLTDAYYEEDGDYYVAKKWYVTYTDTADKTFMMRVAVDNYVVDVSSAEEVGSETGYHQAMRTADGDVRLFLDGKGNAYLYPTDSFALLASGNYKSEGNGIYTLSGMVFTSTANEEKYASYEGKRFLANSNSDTKIFISSDGVGARTYTFYKDGTKYTATFDGFFTAAVETTGGEETLEGYSYLWSYTDGDIVYRVVFITASGNGQNALYLLVEDKETVSEANAYVAELYSDYVNRISAVRNETLVILSDGKAVITDADNNLIAKGTITDGDEVDTYKFTAATAFADDSAYKAYNEFTFKKNSQSGFFYVYRENEVLDGEDLTLDGFGKATYKGSEYAYEISSEKSVASGEDAYEYYTLAISDGKAVFALRLTVNSDGEYEFMPPYEEAAVYASWENSDDGVSTGARVLMLDGYLDKAILYRSTGYSYTQIGEGTYVKNDDGTYTANIGDETFTFKLLYRGNDGEKAYVIPNDNIAKTYTVTGGGSITVDNYGQAVSGNKSGYAAYANDSVVDGLKVFVFYVLDGNGKVTETLSYQLKNDELTRTRSNSIHGKYSLYVSGNVKEATLTLDWVNGAEYYDGTTTVTGTYVLVDAVKKQYKFVPDDGSAGFTFIYMVTSSGNSFSGIRYYYYFQILDETYAVSLTSAEWGTLSLDGYNQAIVVDGRGNKQTASYKIIDDDIARLYFAAGTYAYYELNLTDGTFSKITDEFFIKNGVLIAYQGNASEVVVPETVTAIGERAFFGKNVTSVTLGNNVISVGEYAFGSCVNLTTVSLNNVTSIGEYAFYQCISLESVTLPEGLTVIAAGTFYDCAALKTVVGLERTEEIGDLAFARSGLAAVNLTAVIKIGAGAFAQCFDLAEVSTGSQLIYIGTRAFALCSDDSFVWNIASASVPAAETEILYRTIDGNCSIVVSDVSVACLFAQDSAFSAYTEIIEVSGNAEDTTYGSQENTLVLDKNGRAYLDGEFVGFYVTDGTTVTVYRQADSFNEVVGSISDDVLTITLGGKEYVLTRVAE